MLRRILPSLLVGLPAVGVPTAPAAVLWQEGGVPVCVAASNQFTPVGVPDGTGGAIVAWYDYRNGNADIYAQRVLASGVVDPAWPAGGRALCRAPGGQYSPVAVPDGAGGAIVVWYDDRASSSDIYAQRVLASGEVDPAWPENGRALCAASGDQIYPAAVADGAGGAIVTWRDDRGGPDTDIYAQRVLVSGVVDPGWPANGRAICLAPGNQSVPSIVSDGAGGAILAWSDLRNDIDSDIYAQRVLASGVVDPAWPANGRALCATAWNQSGPALDGDGAGGAIVAWYDYRSGVDADIYAQRVLAGGAPDPNWPPNGRAICTAPGEQYTPLPVTDGAGGAVLVWYDYRGGAEADIYAHHVQASGVVDPAWPGDGRALCAAVGDQVTPAIVADGAGGAVAAWLDYRHGPASDVYAQHVTAAGVAHAAWPADGAALCLAAGDQYSPRPVADGTGGFIVPWTDFRPGVYADLYAQRSDDTGGPVSVAPLASAPFRLHPVRPNPARAGADLRLELGAPERVTVEVLDAAGRRVRTVLRDRELGAGTHELGWDGRDEAGVRRAGGVFWIVARVRTGAATRALVLLP